MDLSTEIHFCQRQMVISAKNMTVDGFSWFRTNYVMISRKIWHVREKVDKGQHQMLGKVCVKVGHGAEHGAEPKNEKISDFFQIF